MERGRFDCSKQYGADKDNRIIMREGERERWVDLGRLITPGLSKDIGIMYDHCVQNGIV